LVVAQGSSGLLTLEKGPREGSLLAGGRFLTLKFERRSVVKRLSYKQYDENDLFDTYNKLSIINQSLLNTQNKEL
jgi:hypothetical protein